MKKLILTLLCLVLMVSLTSCDIVGILFGAYPSNNTSSSSEKGISVSGYEQSSSSSKRASSSEGSQSSSSSSSSTYIPPWHTHTYELTTVEPSCVERGYTEHSCDCGYSFIDTFVEPIGTHSFERGLCSECAEVDYVELINLISTETIKANLTVQTKYSNRSFGGLAETVVGTSNGSGVIIKYTGSEYYALTNNHVVYSLSLEQQASTKSYSVIDYLGTEYKATLVANLANYDLAIVKFTSTESYTVLSLESGNSEEGDLVISLGQPAGQSNTITLGNTVGYTKVRLTDADASESNVTFNVLQHDAYINSGSSGGALLDAQLNVIGINYAGALDEDGNSVESYAIPVEKVYEFFEDVGFVYEEAEEGA